MGKALLCVLLLAVGTATAAEAKKKIKYKSHTELDFTGEQIEGKLRTPAVFYIFQRKRSPGHQAARAPSSFAHHGPAMKSILKEALKP